MTLRADADVISGAPLNAALGASHGPKGRIAPAGIFIAGGLSLSSRGFPRRRVIEEDDAFGKHTPRRRHVLWTHGGMGSADLLGQEEDTAAAPAQVPREGILVGK